MSTISLKIRIPEKNATKTIQFKTDTLIYDACLLVTEKIAEVNHGLGTGLLTLIFILVCPVSPKFSVCHLERLCNFISFLLWL